MTNFEDRLLVQLRNVVAERPAPASRPRRGRLVAASAAVVAAVTAAVLIALGGGASAYAVESSPNGSVTVHINRLGDAAGLQRELRAAGIPAVVEYGAAMPACAAGGGGAAGVSVGGGSAPAPTGPTVTKHAGTPAAPAHVNPAAGPSGAERGLTQSGEPTNSGPSFRTDGEPGPAGQMSTFRVDRSDKGVTFTLDPGTLAPNDRVYITTQSGEMDSVGMAVCPGPRR